MKFVLPVALALAVGLPAAASATVMRTDLSAERPALIKIDDKGKGKGRGKGHGRHERRDERAYYEGLRDGRRQARERQYYQPGYRDFDRSEYRRYGRGQYLPREYQTYVINDYDRYGYPPPPRGCRYVRVGQDTYLTQIATGLILNAFLGGGY
jgi:Ni/Co efflux regulator RcnB